MASGDLPEEKQKYMKAFEEVCGDLLKAASEGTGDGWQGLGEKKGVKVSKKPGESGAVSIMKGTCVVKASMEVIIQWTTELEKIKKWDDTLNTVKVVDKLTEEVRVEHQAYHGSWPTNPRDFCTVSGYKDCGDGVYVLGERSVVHPDAPEIKGNVRAELFLSGFVLKAEKGAEDTFEVTYINQMDPKGNIPKSMMNKINEGTPENLATFRDLVQKAHSGK